MNRYTVSLGLLSGLVGLGIFVFARRPLPPPATPPPVAAIHEVLTPPPAPASALVIPEPPASPSEHVAPAAPSPASSHKRRITIKAGDPIPELFPHQAERDRLIALATTYDAKNIPKIAPSLTHSDASVRAAARQALAQIGDPSAIPYLKNVKATVKDPSEGEAIQETIDFLSLPHVIDVLSMSEKAQQTQL